MGFSKANYLVVAVAIFTWSFIIVASYSNTPSIWRNDVSRRSSSVQARVVCNLLGRCESPRVHHDDKDGALAVGEDEEPELKLSTTSTQDTGPVPKKHLKDVPPYVLKYAPLVHLFSQEMYWPSDIITHLENIVPAVNYNKLPTKRPSITNLHELNKEDGDRGWNVFLDSKDNVEDLPAWLTSEYGIPGSTIDHEFGNITFAGRTELESGRNASTRSSAPAVLIVTEKEHGIVDAFWFFFYSYNLGNGVFGIRFGNHVGDWEHTMIRFVNGVPRHVFLSEHAGGVSYTFEAVEKYGARPVVYSAVGTHAMYATPGNHPYIIPFGILKDQTDKGPLWDPAQNMYSYHYNSSLAHGHDLGVRENPSSSVQRFPFSSSLKTLSPTTLTPEAPISWFHFAGHWGDRYFPLADPRQYHLFSEWAYVSGPPGPKFKALGRPDICFARRRGRCLIYTSTALMNPHVRFLKDWLTVCAILWLIIGLVWLVVWSIRKGCRCCCCARTRASKEVPHNRVDERTALIDPERADS